MSENNAPSRALREEADAAVVGPGVVATKSQMQGGVIGTVVGAIAGALLGLLLGPVIWDGAVILSVIVFAIAGATAGGTLGGFMRNRGRQERGDPDV